MVAWRPTMNESKYEQVILFLLNSIANNDLLGKVKLFKLLYYIDFDHYQAFNTSITGDVYHKCPYGPVGINVGRLLQKMVGNELISIDTKPVGDVKQYVFKALVDAEPQNHFGKSELEVLNRVANNWANHRTGEIVTATHGEAPWRAVNMGEEIPYSLAFYRHQVYEYAGSDDEETTENLSTG